ncbi:MAG: single-stranded DNA-binding protein [Chitinophagaceae bacterium]|nr:MAG: single-stranded DNA-binding protein [Chitinophagaceae bacterium]
MEITGRLTRSAAVKTTKSGKDLVSFGIAINDSYKAKGSDEVTKIVTYVECAYWRSTGIAPYLTKGTIVELSGRIGVNVWNNTEGEAKGQLTFNTNNIKLLGGGSKNAETVPQPHTGKGKKKKNVKPELVQVNDDLPF